MERRTLQTHRPTLVRGSDGKPSKIAGYAAVYYNPSDPGTEYELASFGNVRLVERLMPGCFDRAIREDDVRALFNHNASAVLGRMRSGTLRLFTDNKGLRYEIDAPDTTYARDLLESLKRGDVTGSSFAFEYLTTGTVDQKLPDGSETEIIEVREVRLYDVGPVTFPAYASSSAEARAAQRKAGGGYARRSPEAMLRQVEKMEADLAAMQRRFAPSQPKFSRRRERIRERCARVVAEIEHDAMAQMEHDLAEAMRVYTRAMAWRKQSCP